MGRSKVVPFPLTRRRKFVMRQAAWFLRQRSDAAETNLRRELVRQRAALVRKGVCQSLAEVEVRAVERAIRTEAWLLDLTMGREA